MDACFRGHPRTDADTRQRPGHRECLACTRLRDRARRRGMKADDLFAIEAAGGWVKPLPRIYPEKTLPECWACGRENQPHRGRELCPRCYQRWQQRGFQGPGPGPEFTPQIDRARDHMLPVTTLSARQAAMEIGRSPRTVQRYRRVLREAS